MKVSREASGRDTLNKWVTGDVRVFACEEHPHAGFDPVYHREPGIVELACRVMSCAHGLFLNIAEESDIIEAEFEEDD